MKTKKFIKFINNERVNSMYLSVKGCDVTSYDMCNELDNAGCKSYSYDICNKDFAACDKSGYDYCSTLYDTDACIGSYDYN